jgi:MFS family permease
MLISKIYNKASEDIKYGLASGLAFGLASGLAFGLALGLASGLAVLLIHFSEAFPLIASFYPILFLIFGIIIIAEILFHIEKHNPKKYKSLWFVAKRKIENIFEVLLGLSAISQIYVLAREIKIREWIIKYFPEILKWIGYIGAALAVLIFVAGMIYLYLKLNQWAKTRKLMTGE